MIEIFEGRLGGGKTYSGVARVIAHLVQGGVVCSNIDLLWEPIDNYCRVYHNVILEREQLIVLSIEQMREFQRHIPPGTGELPVLVVIDEAHIFFNSRDWNKQSRETLMFLTQSRKVHVDVIFISQSALNIDKQFHRLVQFVWRFRDMERWKLPLLGINYPFPHIMAIQFDYDGRTLLSRRMIWKDKKVFGLYHTNALVHGFPMLDGITTRRSLQKAHDRWGRFKRYGKTKKQAPVAVSQVESGDGAVVATVEPAALATVSSAF